MDILKSGLFLCLNCLEKYDSNIIWEAMRESPIITEHRAPFRIWRTVAILSVILFLAVCVWAYVTITNL